jgi:hypothetical protein
MSVCNTVFAQYPAPYNFKTSMYYILLGECPPGFCGGESLCNITCCFSYQWEAPDLSGTELQLIEYNIYFQSRNVDTNEWGIPKLIATTTETYFQKGGCYEAGDLWVTAKYSNPDGESAPSNKEYNIGIPISLQEITLQKDLVFDRHQKQIKIFNADDILSVNIFRIDGSRIASISHPVNTIIHTKDFEKGIYIVRIVNKDSSVVTKKLIL